VRSLELTAQAFRYFKGSAAEPLRPQNRFALDSAHDSSPSTLPSQGQNNLTTGTFNLLSKTECASRLGGRVSVGTVIPKTERRVLETCASLQGRLAREDEPFKLTAAVHNVSTCSAQCAALTAEEHLRNFAIL